MKKTDKKKLKVVVDGVHQIISGLLAVDEDQDSHDSITKPSNSTKKATKSANKQKTTDKSVEDTTDLI